MTREPAVSHHIGVFLMVVLAVILVALILSFLLGFFTFGGDDTIAPPHFKITSVKHGGGKLESFIVIRNAGPGDYPNRDLVARFFRNREPVLTGIFTLNGHEFIKTHHYGVQYIGGEGCKDALFARNEMLKVNLKNGLIRPGDLVELRVYQKGVTDTLLPINGWSITDQAYMNRYLEEKNGGPFPGYGLISQHRYQA